MKFPPRGLYAITQTEHKTPDQIVQAVEAALQGGAVVVQYRDKQPVDAVELAIRLRVVCHGYGAPLIVNDSIDLALQMGADGVHLGRGDGDIAEARARLGEGAIIGVSCYDDIAKAEQAVANGADYVAFGRFFASGTKPLAAPAGIETLRLAKQRLRVPVVAIGGIVPSNAGQLLVAGADLLAVIGGVFDQDAKTAAQAFSGLFGQVNL
ncbi:MAG: thiamine phosphate synthase [Methylomonas sp.]|nr:thiamine phosphate synthase [Methylomonas sp.]PPD19791.1 MAG: thiamine phosphate synthase [Methylomonas sp.]PPD25782.1 MAG: thiamine phosphate synthase [Methylomonas sp.]PPD36970.1 MAG: thiamine phosphate synthase [Methylomonas sp.]PPD37246.1 MAG: thiamine phosphate synthase [Methylomonas sp.]